MAEAVRHLEDMTQRGLIFGSYREGRPPRYMVYQFAVGVWEAQVMRLSPELVEDVEQYFKTSGPALWKSAPQLRTIPVGKAVASPLEVMPYERAEELLRAQKTITVTECICRQEMRLLGARLRQAARDVRGTRDLRGVPAAHRARPTRRSGGGTGHPRVGGRSRPGVAAGQLARDSWLLRLLWVLLRGAPHAEAA